MSKKDQRKAGLPILRTSTRKVGVANGGSSKAKYVTQLPFRQLSAQGTQADTFQDFPTSLMSVGKTADNGTVLVFTKEGVNVFKEEDVLITCKGEPILIGVRDSHGRYRIPLVQQRGQWQPQRPSKQVRKTLRHADSVYDLPSTEQAIKWMHAMCGYPVKSTWLKAIKAGNYMGRPMLNERNVQKYYPETIETAKGHLNQTRKNMRSTKAKSAPLETCDTSQLHGKKVRDIYTETYMVCKTMFSNQTGQFPTRSQ
jgi:antitoxin (DNA-binding transcriptional repressor) of toxin-antitoxin stability system